MKRKLTVVLLSLALALALLPATALAAEVAYPVTGGNIYFNSGYIMRADYGITAANIPSTINGEAVISIGEKAFANCASLTSVTIPASMTSLEAGGYWFEGCESLTDVYYGGSEAQWISMMEVYGWEPVSIIGLDPNKVTMHYNSSAPVAPQQPQAPAEPAAPASGFSDVAADAYYYEPVLWAVEKGVTTGRTATTFVPNDPCSVGNILTFLWRAYGEPAATIENPFSDVTEENYYYGAALWAAEKGIVDAGGTFGANDPCTRAMAVTYMWKAAGSPEAQPAAFTDVAADAEYAAAVAWAVAEEITSGYEDNTFRPGNGCSRGNIVTFLYRALAD